MLHMTPAPEFVSICSMLLTLILMLSSSMLCYHLLSFSGVSECSLQLMYKYPEVDEEYPCSLPPQETLRDTPLIPGTINLHYQMIGRKYRHLWASAAVDWGPDYEWTFSHVWMVVLDSCDLWSYKIVDDVWWSNIIHFVLVITVHFNQRLNSEDVPDNKTKLFQA